MGHDDGDELQCAEAPVLLKTLCSQRSSTQVHQARTEARAEAEAAAEQRVAAALALERAELDKQVRRDGCMRHASVAAWGAWRWGTVAEKSSLSRSGVPRLAN